uniref:Uncharacterized protein n=1 Tax=Romanomermis culicivorax TaxID=13658 RepID=A0A915IIC1_ROMCU
TCLTTAIQVVNLPPKCSLDDKENIPFAVINSYSKSNRDNVNDASEVCFVKQKPCLVPQNAFINNNSFKIGDKSTTANYSFTTKLNRDLLMAFNKSISLNSQASNEEYPCEDTNAIAPPLPVREFKIFDENSDTNAAKKSTSNRQPLCAKECDKENVNPVTCQMVPKYYPSGILIPVENRIDKRGSDPVLENKKPVFKLDDSYDYTVAGTSKPFSGSRAISTPFKDKDVTRSLMLSFSMIKPDIENESCVETDYANTEVSLSKQPEPKVINQSQKIFEYQQVESSVVNKLSTIAEENSRDLRSSSSSSSSSSNASSGVDYCNNNRKRFVSSSNLFTISENQAAGGSLSLTVNQTNSTTSQNALFAAATPSFKNSVNYTPLRI